MAEAQRQLASVDGLGLAGLKEADDRDFSMNSRNEDDDAASVSSDDWVARVKRRTKHQVTANPRANKWLPAKKTMMFSRPRPPK